MSDRDILKAMPIMALLAATCYATYLVDSVLFLPNIIILGIVASISAASYVYNRIINHTNDDE